MAKPFLIAHRGVPTRSPEGSASSLCLARDLGAPVIEFDLRASADGQLFVHHDESLAHLFGVHRTINQLSSSELLALRHRNAPAEGLLLFDEALALLVGRARLDIELKPHPTHARHKLLSWLLEGLERAGSPQECLVTSKDAALIKELGHQAPLLERGLVHGFTQGGDAVSRAREAGAAIIVINAQRTSRSLVRRAHDAGLGVWVYTVNDRRRAEALLEQGCDALFTDDFPRLQKELAERNLIMPCAAEIPPAQNICSRSRRESPRLLCLDLGSSSTKAALVDPREGLIALSRRPTPLASSEPGRYAHDPAELLAIVSDLIEELAHTHPTCPMAAALACQRSTALWARRDGLEALTPVLSWRDPGGIALVEALAPERERFETLAGLPLAPAWTAILGRVLLDGREAERGAVLLPLASWIAARLTDSKPRIDPTHANRSFLQAADASGWSTELLEAFGYTPQQLPERVTTIGDHGKLPWPGGGRIPLRCVVGDQQAAYVGAAGVHGHRLVLNLGTAAFVMRRAGSHEKAPAPCRRAPLWSSPRCPVPELFLLEHAIIASDAEEKASRALDQDAYRREDARRVALGDPRLRDFLNEINSAVSALASARDRSVLIAGGVINSPQLLRRLVSELRVPAVVAREAELTLLGAARLAAAGQGVRWAVPEAGGVREDRRLWL